MMQASAHPKEVWAWALAWRQEAAMAEDGTALLLLSWYGHLHTPWMYLCDVVACMPSLLASRMPTGLVHANLSCTWIAFAAQHQGYSPHMCIHPMHC